ncbi:porin PorA family protein [Nocardia gamkensis]|uniref:porin PorA family protein n=1 Tax=Nocardia gamkensis TaxID=352869 RepID=UPI0036EE75E4
MSIRKSSILWLLAGAVLIVGAVLIRFVFVPSMTKLPSDLDQGQKFEGTMQALNPQAMAAGDLPNLLTPPMPITADRSLKVDAVDGDTAIITSTAVVNLPQGPPQTDVHTYAVDRVDFGPVELSDEQRRELVPPNRQATFEPHQGLTFNFPMHPSRDGNLFYDSTLRTTSPAKFVDEQTLENRSVYRYHIDAAGPIGDPVTLAQFKAFPSSVPKAMINGLLQAGLVPDTSRSSLESALPSLPDQLTVGFGSVNNVDVSVDEQFGAPIEAVQNQALYVTVPVNGTALPVLPVSIVKMHTTKSDVASTASTLSSNGTKLTLLDTLLPIGMGVLGIVALGLSVLRRKRSLTPRPGVPEVIESSPVPVQPPL